MQCLSNSVQRDILSSVFALVVALIISSGVYLLLWCNNLRAEAHHGLPKILAVLGFCALRDAYRTWKKYKAEQEIELNRRQTAEPGAV